MGTQWRTRPRLRSASVADDALMETVVAFDDGSEQAFGAAASPPDPAAGMGARTVLGCL